MLPCALYAALIYLANGANLKLTYYEIINFKNYTLNFISSKLTLDEDFYVADLYSYLDQHPKLGCQLISVNKLLRFRAIKTMFSNLIESSDVNRSG